MKPEGATPRALAALGSSVRNNGNFMQIYPSSYGQSNDNISISSYYFHDRVRKNISFEQNLQFDIYVYNFPSFLLFKKNFETEYFKKKPAKF